jgi:hypothetical protein
MSDGRAVNSVFRRHPVLIRECFSVVPCSRSLLPLSTSLPAYGCDRHSVIFSAKNQSYRSEVCVLHLDLLERAVAEQGVGSSVDCSCVGSWVTKGIRATCFRLNS